MLKGEAINLGKKMRRQLQEGQNILPSREELIQFLDVAIYEMEKP